MQLNMVFVDFRKAFDVLNQNSMLDCLQKYEVNPSIYRIISKFANKALKISNFASLGQILS